MKKFDRDGDGTVDKKEFGALLAYFKRNMTDKDKQVRPPPLSSQSTNNATGCSRALLSLVSFLTLMAPLVSCACALPF